MILIHENVVEQRADFLGKLRHLHQLGPVEQEIIVIENMLLLLGGNIGVKQGTQLLFPLGAPWEAASSGSVAFTARE